MLQIESYFKIGETFTKAEDFIDDFPDPNYIEGCISIVINDKPMIGRKEWDYVDQLWAYIVNGLIEIAQNRPFSCYFPDQPIELTFTPLNNDMVRFAVRVHEEKSAVVPRAEFMSAFKTAGSAFFRSMERLRPRDGATRYLDKLDAL